MKKNDSVKLEIIDMNKDGLGVAKVDDMVYFVKNALYGDVVIANVTKVNKNLVYAKATNIFKVSKYRNSKKCEVSDSCGGCQIFDLRYEKQVELKENFVKNNLIKIAGLNKSEIENVYCGSLIMDEPFYYRNKVQVPLAYKNNKLIYGFFASRTHYVIENSGCFISFKESNKIINSICSCLMDVNKKLNVPLDKLIYNEEEHKGLFREILIRKANYQNDISITIIVNDTNYKNNMNIYSKLKDLIIERIKSIENVELKTITLNINNEKNNVLLGKENIVLYGGGFIEDMMLGIKFQISPMSFYQVNNVMTKKLYETIIDFMEANGDETVLDLYCGIGTISLIISKYVKKVYGIEIVKEAIDNANCNMKINNISNAEFLVADIDKFFSLEEKIESNESLFFENIKNERIDTIIVDPPRKGLTINTIEFIKKISPKKIIYVSCDSATLSRDLKVLLADEKYKVSKIKIVDMFPNTMHVECCCLVEKL